MLVNHKIWKPTSEEPTGIEATIEWYLRQLYSQNQSGCGRGEILRDCDPFQRAEEELRRAEGHDGY